MSADYTVGVPTLPEHSIRYKFWVRLQHWFGEHLAWLPRSWSVDVNLYRDTDESWPGPRVGLFVHGPCSPEHFAGGVARVWEDCPTTAATQETAGRKCLRLKWTTPGPDSVEVMIWGPDCDDVEPYRQALVDAGVLRDPAAVYWAVLFGGASADQIAFEYDLTPGSDADLDEWLGTCEAAHDGEVPAEGRGEALARLKLSILRRAEPVEVPS